MKNTKQRFLKGAIILAMAVIVSMVVFFVLALCGVISANPFKLGFTILAFGIGGIFTVYGLIARGGYEVAVGYLLLTVAIIVTLIGVLVWYGILVIAAAMVVLGILLLMVSFLNCLRLADLQTSALYYHPYDYPFSSGSPSGFAVSTRFPNISNRLLPIL